MIAHDSHSHFFSPRFFEALAQQRRTLRLKNPRTSPLKLLSWQSPRSPGQLSDRWVRELDRNRVGRMALISSVPGDERSVAAAVRRHPKRFVGFFMLDPTSADSLERARRGLTELGLRCICLYPAMHRFSVHEDRVRKVFETAAGVAGAAVFVHCGVLSIGVRTKLGLPSHFDMGFSNPLDLHSIAAAHPSLPIIIPHFGGGLFREALMVADLCPNIYLDTSSSNSWTKYYPGLTLTEVFRQALEVLGPDRLLFGSDSSFFPRGWQHSIWEEQATILNQLGVDRASKERIFRRNFHKLFPVNKEGTVTFSSKLTHA